MSQRSAERNSERAKQEILRLLSSGDETKVAYDREIRYRLESLFPHDDIGNALKELLREGKVKRVKIPGRRGDKHAPNLFYCLPNTPYKELIPLMRKKLELSLFISGVSSHMGRHAELVWWRAFKQHNWNVYPSDEEDLQGVREYGGRKTTQPNDIDFIAEKDGIEYGVEVKNSLGYPEDLYWKFLVATELKTIPLIIARWLNPVQVQAIKELGGAWIIYKTAIFSTTYASLIQDTIRYLGLPVEARDEIDPHYFQTKTNQVHQQITANLSSVRDKLQKFLNQTDHTEARRKLGVKTE